MNRNGSVVFFSKKGQNWYSKKKWYARKSLTVTHNHSIWKLIHNNSSSNGIFKSVFNTRNKSNKNKIDKYFIWIPLKRRAKNKCNSCVRFLYDLKYTSKYNFVTHTHTVSLNIDSVRQKYATEVWKQCRSLYESFDGKQRTSNTYSTRMENKIERKKQKWWPKAQPFELTSLHTDVQTLTSTQLAVECIHHVNVKVSLVVFFFEFFQNNGFRIWILYFIIGFLLLYKFTNAFELTLSMNFFG